MKNKIIILFFILSSSLLYSQKEAFNWYFGEYAGITFNTPDLNPITLLNSVMATDEGCATISDGNGRLLFYTDGITVWDRNNTIMPGGTGLLGSKSSTQSAVIVKKPGNDKIYYIITTDSAEGNNGCRYSVVDMELNSGFGQVISKNNILFTASTEKLVAIRHANRRDWWILTHEWESDVFRAFLIDENGINTFAVFSIIGTIHTGSNKNKTGYMKASRNGTKLALVLPDDGIVELFDFNNEQGKVLNPVTLKSLVLKDVYGLEFSPDGKLLYVSRQESPSVILQYDLSAWTASAILITQMMITNESGYGAYQALQLGPDNRIYVARYNKSFLGRINEPGKRGADCNYVDSAIYLKGKLCKKGLPNIYSNDAIELNITSNSPVCIGDSVRLTSDYIFLAKYEWTGPDGFYSDKQNVSFLALNVTQSGYYRLKVSVSDVEYEDSVYVLVKQSPYLYFSVTGNEPFCDGDSILLQANSDEQVEFRWSTGDTTQGIYVTRSGLYSVTVTDESGCSTTRDTLISVYKIPTEIVPLDDIEFCRGDSVELIALPLESGAELLWSNGSTEQSIIVKNTSTVILKITSIEGCVKYDTLQVNVYDKLQVRVFSDEPKPYCKGDTINLKTNYNGQDFVYLWSNGETGPEIKITDDMKGWVYVRLKSGCGDTAYFDVKFNVKPNVFVTTDKPPVICYGEAITLKAVTNNTSERLSYLWSTGDTTQEIKTGKPGRYTVEVKTDSGCTNSSYIDVTVLPSPEVNIQADGPTERCIGEIIKLTAVADDTNYTYKWSTGATTREIFVNTSGNYYVVAYNANNCTDTARITIEFYDKPQARILADGPVKICEGNDVTLSTEKSYASYLWNTGDTSRSIRVTNSGSYWVQVTDSNGCTGESNTIDVTVSRVDILIDDLSQTKFGNVCLGNVKRQSFEITNNSNEAIEIQSLTLPAQSSYSLQTVPELPATIPHNASLSVDLTFAPEFTGTFLDTLELAIVSPCYYMYQLTAEGNGIIRTFAKIPDTARPIGMAYCIPVIFRLNCGDTLNETISFKTTVEIDALTFLPDDTLHPFIKNHYVSGDKRIFEIEGTIDYLAAEPKEIFSICGTIFLGEYEWSNVNLGEIKYSNPYVSTISLGGELEIYGVCEFNISQIRLSNRTNMTLITGKDVNDITVEISTEETGEFELAIYTLTGQKCFSKKFSKNTDKLQKFEFKPNTQAFPSGYYYIILRSNKVIRTKPLIINK